MIFSAQSCLPCVAQLVSENVKSESSIEVPVAELHGRGTENISLIRSKNIFNFPLFTHYDKVSFQSDVWRNVAGRCPVFWARLTALRKK